MALTPSTYLGGKDALAIAFLKIFGIDSTNVSRASLEFAPNDAVTLHVKMFATRDQIEAVNELLAANVDKVSVDQAVKVAAPSEDKGTRGDGK